MGVAAAVVGGVTSVAGGLINSGASKSAANTQAAADQHAADQQKQMFEESKANLAPYNQTGQGNLPIYSDFYKTSAAQLGSAYDEAHQHIPQAMTQANLEATPGYQFNLSQGLRAAQNSNAAQGLGVSGAALQGASKFATGLADSTYQNQFSNQQAIYNDYLQQAQLKGSQLGQIYGQISAPVNLGENAAATSGNQSVQAGQNIGGALQAGGVAQSAGITGSANALSGAISGVGNAGLSYLALNQLNGGGGGGGSGSSSSFWD